MTDPNLREHATERQWEILEAIDSEGSITKAAKKLGINASNVSRARALVLYKAAQKGYAPGAQLDNPTAPGFSIIKTSTMRGPDDEVKLRWTQECPDKHKHVRLILESGNHDHQKELPGLMTESHGILAPKDAHASKSGYRSQQSMKSITYHKDFGEVSRQMFKPQMIR